MRMTIKKNALKLLLLLLLLGSAFLALRFLGADRISPEAIRTYILSFGVWAPILYIFLYIIRPLALFPASLLSISGGLAFGPLYGTIYDIVGASLGAYLSFGLTKKLGRQTVKKWFGHRMKGLDDKVELHGFGTILTLRLIPLVPFDAISYGAGLSKVRFRDFAWGTSLGMIPGAIAYNFLGHSLHDLFSPMFFLAVGIVLALSAIPTLYQWRKKRKTS